jgi:general stress protein YciG
METNTSPQSGDSEDFADDPERATQVGHKSGQRTGRTKDDIEKDPQDDIEPVPEDDTERGEHPQDDPSGPM